ncbi:hypothetical protein BG006_002343, partial [Podila minutissima]
MSTGANHKRTKFRCEHTLNKKVCHWNRCTSEMATWLQIVINAPTEEQWKIAMGEEAAKEALTRLAAETEASATKAAGQDRISAEACRQDGIDAGSMELDGVMMGDPGQSADGPRTMGYAPITPEIATMGNILTVGSLRVSKFMKNMITYYLEQGFEINQIQRKIDSDFSRAVQQARALGKRPNRDYYLTYMDVYNIQYKAYIEKSEKAMDPTKSAQLWMEELKAQHCFTYMDGKGSYGFATKWQISHLLKDGHTLCFDGTHEIYGKSSYLFTLIVRDQAGGFGIPVAFLLTEIQTAECLELWLKALTDFIQEQYQRTYAPKVVVMDAGSAEWNSVSNAFPNAKTFLCSFHVLAAIFKRLPKKLPASVMEEVTVTSEDGVETIKEVEVKKEELKTRVMDQLWAIVFEKDLVQAEVMLAKFKSTWGSFKDLMEYLNLQYFYEDTQKRWMVAHRQEDTYNDMNTNNSIESWHRTLKVKIDVVQAGEKSPERREELKRVQKAETFMAKWKLDNHKGSPIEQINKTTLPVPSFPAPKPSPPAKSSKASNPATPSPATPDPSCSTQDMPSFYDVKINWPARTISSCTCLFFHQNRNKCKHIALAILDIGCVEFEPPVCHAPVLGSVTAALSDEDEEEEEEVDKEDEEDCEYDEDKDEEEDAEEAKTEASPNQLKKIHLSLAGGKQTIAPIRLDCQN